ncbi:TetR/AcrR family transcriptional regulator [Paenibacillus sedimenti]|uniref:TetR/AcrR family transcriptional regulator n=1 Tax=Paenibacillus sedimenti TaxID=2770274 RepID=A0A926KQ39_9BACL|nr:TetR/AcrR family transcriptional regulator [Paenibacillus sedimenti]MBD0381977.1 TetR/AcrR family transcriptional regulator [Paenibacillus sedimenti]
MRKSDKTKIHIIMKSAELFNQKGYAATTMQDIMDATGLTKGGLYRNFPSKDEIAIEAFKYAGEVLWGHFSTAIEGRQTATEKVLAMCDVYSDTVNNPPMSGGCPFLNTAVESDHSFPVLRDYALGAYEQMSSFIQGILEQGVAVQEFQSDMDTESAASFIFSSIEGAIMASRLTRDNKHVHHAMKQIERWLMTFKPPVLSHQA